VEGRDQERFRIARKMRAAGLPPEVVAEVTGLTVDEISGLKDEDRVGRHGQ
jgi:hypothetical protein